MTAKAYSDPLLQEATTKISAIIDGLPEELKTYALHYVQYLSNLDENEKEAADLRNPSESLLAYTEASILEYARIKGRIRAENSLRRDMTTASLSHANCLRALETLYGHWNDLKD